MEPLDDAELMRELDTLARRLAIRARSRGAGEKLTRRRGGASEFQEHRGYTYGDDLRNVDWAAYARTDEPVLKVFRAEEDSVVRIVCDASASLDYGEPRKIDVARRISAAIGYLAFFRSERAQMFVSHETLSREQGGMRGPKGLSSLLRGVARVEARGGTDLGRAVDALVKRTKRPGLLALVSDFLDPGPVEAALGRAVSAGHDLALVHVFTPDEASPSFEGDLTLEDAETGRTVDVTMDGAAIAAYEARFLALQNRLRSFSKKHRASYVPAITDTSLLAVMQRFVTRSIG